MLSGLYGKLIAAGGVLLAVLAIVWRLIAYGKTVGTAQRIQKEEQARAENKERLRKAVASGDAVSDDPGDIMHDPDNRASRRR